MISSHSHLLVVASMLLLLRCGAAELKWKIDPTSGRWTLGESSLGLHGAVTSLEVDGAWIAMSGGTAGESLPIRDAIGDGDRAVVTSTANGLELSQNITLYRGGSRALVEATLRNVGDRPRW